MVPRTRLGDDFVVDNYKKSANPCRQLVQLGAGLDSRPWRLEGVEELRVFEIDQPSLFAWKNLVVEDNREEF